MASHTLSSAQESWSGIVADQNIPTTWRKMICVCGGGFWVEGIFASEDIPGDFTCSTVETHCFRCRNVCPRLQAPTDTVSHSIQPYLTWAYGTLWEILQITHGTQLKITWNTCPVTTSSSWWGTVGESSCWPWCWNNCAFHLWVLGATFLFSWPRILQSVEPMVEWLPGL